MICKRKKITIDDVAILNISLKAAEGEDILAWSLEKSSTCSIKSAYRAPVIQKEHSALKKGQLWELHQKRICGDLFGNFMFCQK
jgi:hypothetical protein